MNCARKVCTKCGVKKPLEDFHRRKASKDGREFSCKGCRAGYYQANRKRMDANSTRWRKENPERARELSRQRRERMGKEYWRAYHAAWREAHQDERNAQARGRYDPEKEAERRADYKRRNPDWSKRHYWANHDVEIERGRRRYRDNVEAESERKKRYRDENPRVGRESSRRRRARDREVGVGRVDEGELAIRQTGRCGICSTDLYEPIELDHIVPISRGGAHSQTNCQLAHLSCNRQKHDKLSEECDKIKPFRT